MILTTHAVVGAALAQHTESAPVAFSLGVISHYLLDAIPHWDKYAPTITSDKPISSSSKALKELFMVTLDFGIGILIALLFFRANPTIMALAILGAILPDILRGLNLLWPNKILTLQSKFHDFMHSNMDLNQKPILGIGIQIVIILLAILLW